MGLEDLEYLSSSEISSEFIPGGSVMSFVPGWNEGGSRIPGESIEGGKYIGLIRIWGGDRKLDVRIRIVDGQLEEKRDYYYQGEIFHSDGWSSSVGTWDRGTVTLPEGVTHTLRSYIELYVLDNWGNDEINEIWWEAYEDYY